MPSWLVRLMESRRARSIEAPCDVSELCIQAGDTLDYDPREPDVLIHVRLIYRHEVEAVMRRRQSRRACAPSPASLAAVEHASASPQPASSPATGSYPHPYLRLVP